MPKTSMELFAGKKMVLQGEGHSPIPSSHMCHTIHLGLLRPARGSIAAEVAKQAICICISIPGWHVVFIGLLAHMPCR